MQRQLQHAGAAPAIMGTCCTCDGRHEELTESCSVKHPKLIGGFSTLQLDIAGVDRIGGGGVALVASGVHISATATQGLHIG